MRKLFSTIIAGLAALCGLTAFGSFTWNGGDITTAKWAVESNWTPDGSTWPSTGSGPATTNSNAWDPVIINGASGSVADLEGWNFKLCLGVAADKTTLGTASTLTIDNVRKFQGGDKYIVVGKGSELTLSLGVSNSGNDGGTLPITFVDGGTMNFKLARDKGGDVTTVDYGSISDANKCANVGAFNLSSTADGTSHTYNSLTIKATIAQDVDYTTEATLHTIPLATISSDITVTTLGYAITATGYAPMSSVPEATEANIGNYYIGKDDAGKVTLYYVTGVPAKLVWNGTEDSHAIDATSKNWLSGSVSVIYADDYALELGTAAESKTVTLAGTDVSAKSITVADAYSFDVTSDTTVAANGASLTGDGSVTKTGSATLTMNSDNATALKVAVNAGTLALSDSLSAASEDLSAIAIGDSGTLSVTSLSTGDSGTIIQLDSAASGKLEVKSGKLNMNGQNSGSTTREFGNAEIVMNGGNMVFVNYPPAGSNGNTVDNDVTVNASTTDVAVWGSNSSAKFTGTFNASGKEVTKSDGGTIDFGGTTTIGSLKTSAGTAKVSGEATVGTVTAKAGTTAFAGTSTVTMLSGAGGAVNFNDGANVSINQFRLGDQGASTVTLNSGATVKITGTTNNHSTSDSVLLAHWSSDTYGESKLVLAGGTFDASGTTIHLSWDGKGTLEVNKGTVKAKEINGWANSGEKGVVKVGTGDDADGTALIELGSGGINDFTSNVTVELGNGTLKVADGAESSKIGANQSIGASGHGTATLSATGDKATTLDTNGQTFNFNAKTTGSGNITATGNGTVNFQHDESMGRLTIDEGTTVTTRNGNSFTIGATIVNNGTLTNSSTLKTSDLGNLTKGTATYSAGDNGYQNDVYLVYSGSGTATGVSSITVGTDTTTDYTVTDGKVTVAGTSGTYYVNSGTATYSAIAGESTTGVNVKGGTLTIDETPSKTITVDGDCVIYINEGVTLNQSSISITSGTVTIDGKGTYAITAAGSLGATLAEGWTGTVQVPATTTQDGQVPLQNYGNNNSKIDIQGLTGTSVWLASENVTVAAETILNGDMTLNNGGSQKTYTFNKISGTGDLTLTAWAKCYGSVTFTINELNGYTGTIALSNQSTHNNGCAEKLCVGNIVKDDPQPGTALVLCTQSTTSSGTKYSTAIDLANAKVNSESRALAVTTEGIFLAVAQIGETNFATFDAAIDALQDGETITVLDSSDAAKATLTNPDWYFDAEGKLVKKPTTYTVTFTCDYWGEVDFALVGGGTLTADHDYAVEAGKTLSFTVSPKSGSAYAVTGVSNATLESGVYTTDEITAAATIKITLELSAPEVKPGAGETSVEVAGSATDDKTTIEAKVTIKSPDTTIVTDAAYAAYFTKDAQWNSEKGKWVVTVTLANNVVKAEEETKALADSLAAFAAGTTTTAVIGDAKPGLWYSVKEGTVVNDRTEGDRTQADKDGAVTLTVTVKGGTSGFYQVLVNSTNK